MIYTVRRKIFVINNFREFREWRTFANIIIANFYVRTYTVYLSTHYTIGDVTLRWRTSTEALCLVKPSSGRSQWDHSTILSHLHNHGTVFTHHTV